MTLAIIKALHLFAAFAWMAGLWYYPRLLIYQREQFDQGQKIVLLQIMAQRLMKFILMPAMTFCLVFGFWLGISGGYFSVGWFHAKLLCVGVLVGLSIYLAILGRKMRSGDYPLSTKQLRYLNEVPTVILFAILFFAVVYPVL